VEVLPETPNRLAIVAILFSVAFFLSWTAAPPAPAGTFPILDLTTGLALAASIVIFWMTRRHRNRPPLLVQAATAYQIFACLTIALSEHWLPWSDDVPVRGISWLTLVLISFPLAVPVPPKITLVTSLIGASMGPLAIALTTLRGNALPSIQTFLALVLPTYLSAGIAYVLSRALHRLGSDAAKARRIGNYELIQELGRGGMGEVWLAKHRLLKRPAAVKFVRPGMIAESIEDTHTIFRRFEREAQTTAALSSPHTISLFDYGYAEDGSFYYVMELLDGLDLETLVSRYGPVPAERTIHILVQACWSLAEAHQRALIHRDVKPANVYVCRLGMEHDFVKVLDFGLVITGADAEKQLTRLTKDGLTSGTPAYMAPEIATGSAIADGRADIYALGCVAYFLLTGRMVFESASQMRVLADHVQTQPLPPSQRTELPISEDLETIVLACLEKNPERRPQSAEELAERLLACELAGAWTRDRAERWWKTNMARKS
jgi:serine/threonine-protein kinase